MSKFSKHCAVVLTYSHAGQAPNIDGGGLSSDTKAVIHARPNPWSPGPKYFLLSLLHCEAE